MSRNQQRTGRGASSPIASTSGVQNQASGRLAPGQMEPSNVNRRKAQDGPQGRIPQKRRKQETQRGVTQRDLQRGDILQNQTEASDEMETDSDSLGTGEKDSEEMETDSDRSETGEENIQSSESILAAEDRFSIEDDLAEHLQIHESDIPKPPYHDPQIFLADSLLARIELMLGGYGVLEEKFKKFKFQIYTANVLMLEQQTQSRLADPMAECFSLQISSCEKTLREAAESCVKKYTTSKAVNKCHRDLINEAKKNRDTLYLIVCDEAHWGTTSESTDPKSQKTPGESKQKAYNTLVNSWNARDFPNSIVLQVTATPYNLLTENTRLFLDTMCVWEQHEEERVLKVLEPDEKTSKKQVRLYHMKWTESFEFAIQAGVRQVIKIPEKSKAKSDQYLYVAEDDTLKRHSSKDTELILKGDNSDRVQILTSDNKKALVVHEINISKTRGKTKVKFVAKEALCEYEENSYLFRITLCGQDVFLLETTDQKLQLTFSEKEEIVIAESEPSPKATPQFPFVQGSFVVYSSQPLENIEQGVEYVSLNFLINSVGEQFDYHQYFRGDNNFVKLSKEKNLEKYDEYDILTADYALHIVHINEVRQCKLVTQDLKVVLKDMPLACGQYTQRRDALIGKLAMELKPKPVVGGKKSELSRIDPALFLEVTSVFEKQTEKAFLDGFKNLVNTDDLSDFENVCSYLVGCLLFLRRPALLNLQRQLGKLLKERDEVFKSNLCSAFRTLDFEEHKTLRIEETETCRLIDNLVIRDLNEQLEGPMKIVRMTTESGNRMYATLCLARKLSSEQYTFEILRDYSTFKISEVVDNTDVATYRIRKILQRKCCDYVDKSGEKCHCKDYKPTVDLTCAQCKHIHTRVKNYVDLNHLPCLLIMVDKGRMGDTFPESFNSMDLRASSENKSEPVLATLTQELGRLCRYVNKKEEGAIPYALLGEGLAEKITSNRQKYATFYAGYKQIDPKVSKHNKATNKSSDNDNDEKQKNRLLFEAEPQIGKTGVFLCLISMLRKKIEERDQEEEEQVDDENDDGEDGSQGIEDDESPEVMTQSGEKELEKDWRYPYWKYVQRSSRLKKMITTGKYVSVYGPYKYGKTPERLISKQQKVLTKKSAPRIVQRNQKFRTYPKTPAQSLCKWPVSGTGKIYKVDIDEMKIKLSIPTLRCFRTLFEKLNLESSPGEAEPFLDEKETLKTWIFTPSYGRSKKAYLNYNHTMVDSNGNDVHYVHIIVVRPSEFLEYFREWGCTHAVVCLPDSLPQAGNLGPEEGGIGFTRVFIQLMAKFLKLPAVFMLDDNILGCSEVQAIEDNEEKTLEKTENGKHVYKPIPLFSSLKYMEQQMYGAEKAPPKEPGLFEPYPDVQPNTQESFTGPWSVYGIIGMLRHNKFVYSYKNAFNRTHVMAAVLVNIQAITEKGLFYKPWQVWEDLNMNNQCDEAGLWVVKYNRFVIRKINMPDSVPKAFIWTEDTQMKEVVPDGATDCIPILKRYIVSCGLNMISKVQCEPKNEVCEDVETLVGNLKIQKDEANCQLVAIEDKKLGRSDIVSKLKKTYVRSQKNLLLVLSAAACLQSNLTNRMSVWTMLRETIEGDFDFSCVTSVDATEKPVSLVLVHIKKEQPAEVEEDASSEDIFQDSPSIIQGHRPFKKKEGEVIDLTEEEDTSPTKTEDKECCVICQHTGDLKPCGSIVKDTEIPWIKSTFRVRGPMTRESNICDFCSSEVESARASVAKTAARRQSSPPVEFTPTTNVTNVNVSSLKTPVSNVTASTPMPGPTSSSGSGSLKPNNDFESSQQNGHNGSYSCVICSEQFDNKEDWEEHIKEEYKSFHSAASTDCE